MRSINQSSAIKKLLISSNLVLGFPLLSKNAKRISLTPITTPANKKNNKNKEMLFLKKKI